MSERGLPITDGAPACPFVAFEDDRDERAASPDHRHRCYAEVRPAPRALAHQEAYCLSSAFPVCPTFQDWARREAARARQAADAAPMPVPPEPQRNPPRDWSAPPPWLSDDERDAFEAGDTRDAAPGGAAGAAAAGAAAAGAAAPDFLAGRAAEGAGLAGSRADRLAGPAADVPPTARTREEPLPAEPPAARVSSAARGGVEDEDDEFEDDEWEDDDRSDERARRGAAAGGGLGFGDRRPRVGQTRRREPLSRGPSWERPRREEAYPTIRTRVAMPSIPRVGLMAIAILIAALALFFLPGLLPLGGGGTGSATPSPSAARPSASGLASPTTPAAPSAQTYIVKSGDTLSKIAKKFGVSLDDLIAANHATLPNPDKLQIGDVLVIPTPGGGAASAAPSDSAAP